VWRLPVSETRRFIETAWAQGAELVSVVPVRRDLTELFLEWTRNDTPREHRAESQNENTQSRHEDAHP
jgi:hypothetical protein